MLNKADLIEQARIMYEAVFGLDSEDLNYDLVQMTYKEVQSVHASLTELFDTVTGESACWAL